MTCTQCSSVAGMSDANEADEAADRNIAITNTENIIAEICKWTDHKIDEKQ